MTEVIEIIQTPIPVVEVVPEPAPLVEIAAYGPQGPPGPAGAAGAQGPAGAQGDQGPQGIQGIPGEGAQPPFVQRFTTPSDTWVVTHNLGYTPAVTVEDLDGVQVLASFVENTDTQTTLVHAQPVTGVVICR